MSLVKFEEYYMAIDVLINEETINLLTPSIYPHLKSDRRTKLFNDLKRQISIKLESVNKEIKTYGEIVGNLKRKLGRG